MGIELLLSVARVSVAGRLEVLQGLRNVYLQVLQGLPHVSLQVLQSLPHVSHQVIPPLHM